MLVKIQNPQVISEERTTIAKGMNAGEAEIVVQNNEGVAAEDYVIIGKIGEEQSELHQVESVSAANTVIIKNTVSFPHPIGTSVATIPYNQVEFQRKTSASGTFSVIATVNLRVNQLSTPYNDVSGQSFHFYRARFKNESTGQFSDFSGILRGVGYTTKAVKTMIDTILKRTNDENGDFTTREEVMQDLDYGYQELVNAIMHTSSEYYLKKIEVPTEDFKYEYTLPDDFREISEVRDGEGDIVKALPRDVISDLVPGYELTGINTIRFNDVPTPVGDSSSPTVVLQNNESTEDGTWSASEDATNITNDLDEFKIGTGAINFDIDVSLSSSNVAVLENSTFTAQDLSDFEDSGKWRVWVYIPDVTYITSFDLRWGTSSSVYWALNITKDYKEHAFHDGWNLLEFDWSSADITETGSPSSTDAAAINYLQLRMNYSAGQPDDEDFRLDAIRIATVYNRNDVYEISYLRQPAQIRNEMDEVELPPGNQSVLLDYVVAQIMLRHGNRDVLSQRLLTRFEERIGKFVSQSSKRTRRTMGMRLEKRRPYGVRRGFRWVHRNNEVYFPRD